MIRSSLAVAVIATLGVCVNATRGADATTPVDYTQRNTPFKPGTPATQPEKRKPEIDHTIQDKRVTPEKIEKKEAAVGDKRAAIDMKEKDEKNIIEKDSRKPEKIEQPKSRYDQQRSQFSTSEDTKKPPMVAKYQDSLTAANAVKTGKLSAMQTDTKAKVNRFVFRKNGGELADAAQGASVTPAAGGSALKK
ncbi:MAG: hypothetical protein V4773_04840 [Verrucomicrobiota bacterium]